MKFTLIASLATSWSLSITRRCVSASLNSSSPSTVAFAVHANGDAQRYVSTTTSTARAAANSEAGSSSSSNSNNGMTMDDKYPGTAVERMNNVRDRVRQLAQGDDLNQRWEDVRRRILWAGGLKDLPNSQPGQGYTGHAFNDYNHVDLTCMIDNVSDRDNSDGNVAGIARNNQLGPGVRIASLPELGPGGSWSTCITGCAHDPPRDVAHVQFKARIAFKLVWVPNSQYDTFVLVDDGKS